MHISALLPLFAAIVAPVAVLSAPQPGGGGYGENHGHYGAVSSGNTTTRLSADPELASRISEYIAHQRTKSLSSYSTETHSPISGGSTTVISDTTTETSTSDSAVSTQAPGPYGNSTTTVEGENLVVPKSKGYEI